MGKSSTSPSFRIPPDSLSTRLTINALAVDLVEWQHRATSYRVLALEAIQQLALAHRERLRLEQRVRELREELRRYTAAAVVDRKDRR